MISKIRSPPIHIDTEDNHIQDKDKDKVKEKEKNEEKDKENDKEKDEERDEEKDKQRQRQKNKNDVVHLSTSTQRTTTSTFSLARRSNVGRNLFGDHQSSVEQCNSLIGSVMFYHQHIWLRHFYLPQSTNNDL